MKGSILNISSDYVTQYFSREEEANLFLKNQTFNTVKKQNEIIIVMATFVTMF